MWAALLGFMLECSTRILPEGISLLGFASEAIAVARASDLHFFKAFDWPDFSDDLFRDLAWRLAKFFGQLEGERKSVLPEFDFGWLLDDDPRQIEVVGTSQEVTHMLGKPVFQMTVQEVPLSC